MYSSCDIGRIDRAMNKFKKVHIHTVKNGYAADIKGRQYMYFGDEDLVAGLFVHLGLDIELPQDIDISKAILEAVLSWPTLADMTTANATLLAEIKELRDDVKTLRDRNAYLDGQRLRLQRDMAKLQSRYEYATERIYELDKMLGKKKKYFK